MINNSEFIIKSIPDISPYSPERLVYWKEQKRRIHEGHWIGSKWMPPDLYFYINFWHILISENENSKTKKIGRPFLRDLEWEKSFILQEAKGFSGFELDSKYTCHRGLAPKNVKITKELFPDLYEELKNKIYIPAREYLRKSYHEQGALGKPIYYNEASNVIDIESRGTGKSYKAASDAAHNFLTDGVTDYDLYLEGRKNKIPYSSETVIGAYDSKWSNDLIKKIKLGLNHLPGSTKVNKKSFPSPLYRMFSGSWESGKTIIQEYDIKRDGEWVTEGTQSKIQHRSFKDNPFAANGTRPNLAFIEESGFMSNLRRTLGQLKDSTSYNDTKFGVIWALGTGGDMEGGATEEAKKVFYNTEDFDCLSFDDIYEGKGQIGLFIPSHMGLNQFRNHEGIIDKQKALRKTELRREKALKSTDRRVWLDEIQNRPEKPSEAFFASSENILDIPSIEEHCAWLASKQQESEYRGLYGELIINSEGKVEFIRDVKNKLEPADFPIKKGKQPPGCVVIWEPPEKNIDGKIPYGTYIAATDPYDQDQAENTVSMGSTFIMKRYTYNGIAYKRIVAEYTGRPRLAKMHHETVRRLLIYYHATDLYENEKMTMKLHFEQKHSLHLLADTPDIIKTQTSSKIVKTGSGRGNKGIGMPPNQQSEVMFLVKEYLEEPLPDNSGLLYLHTIKSIPLLKELIAYNDTGNFDRVISFMILLVYDAQLFNIKVKEAKEKKKRDYFFQRLHLGKNGNNGYNTQNSTFLKHLSDEKKEPFIPTLFKR